MSVTSSVFQPVIAADRVDYPALEQNIQRWWDEQKILQAYLHRKKEKDNIRRIKSKEINAREKGNGEHI